MVATSLPFWMQHPSRTMLPFLAHPPAARADGSAPRAPRPRPAMWQSALVVELCEARAIETHGEAWADLARRAAEPNVFLEPGFAMPAVLHFPPSRRPTFLLCWDGSESEAPMLVGLLALQAEAAPWVSVAVAWQDPQWVCSAPLLDRTKGAQALDAMLGWLAGNRRFRGGLLVQGVAVGGPLMRLLTDDGRRQVAVLDTRSRATLDPHANGEGPDAKRRKELRRQKRRLGATVEVVSAHGGEEVRVATERFLDLEARGWKGARRTALLNDARLATFTRTMTRLMAARGLCRIDTLLVDGAPAAMGIVLRSGDRGFFWKTAFDETRRRHSPGKQLALAISDLQRADPSLALTDSCAVPDHPMIDGMWAGRMDVADILVACPGSNDAPFERAAKALRLGRAARSMAKRLVGRLRASRRLR